MPQSRMNDTWSVRPVLSSTTGEYFAMSLGRYAGTDCGLGSTGVEPTWSNRSGFSSGMLKLYFRPSTWNAWLTASAVASRNACAAAADDVVQVVLGAKVSSRVLDAVLVHVRDHHGLALRTVRDQLADVGDAR